MSPLATSEPTELIYVARPSWAPVLVAIGTAGILAGFFGGRFWSIVGLGIVLLGLRSWWRLADDEVSRMRREQATDTAVIPAEPIRVRTGTGS